MRFRLLNQELPQMLRHRKEQAPQLFQSGQGVFGNGARGLGVGAPGGEPVHGRRQALQPVRRLGTQRLRQLEPLLRRRFGLFVQLRRRLAFLAQQLLQSAQAALADEDGFVKRFNALRGRQFAFRFVLVRRRRREQINGALLARVGEVDQPPQIRK